MATSGEISYQRTRNQIIRKAAVKIGAIDARDTLGDSLVEDFSSALNGMVKNWQATGVKLYQTREAVLFLQKDQRVYELGQTSPDHASESFVKTQLAAGAAVGSTTLSVTDATGIAVDDYIGVQTTDNTLSWAQVTNVTNNQITTDTPLTASASAGSFVFAYTNKLTRPLAVLSGRRHNWLSEIDTPLIEYDREAYQQQPNKTVFATSTAYYYDRRRGGGQNGEFYAWQVPGDVSEGITFTHRRPIEIFTDQDDNPDFPEEWTRVLEWNLAAEMMDDYSVPDPKYSRVIQKAAVLLAEASWYEGEAEDVRIKPEYSWMRTG